MANEHDKKRWPGYLFIVAGMLWFLAGAIGGKGWFVPIGLPFVILGIAHLRKSQTVQPIHPPPT